MEQSENSGFSKRTHHCGALRLEDDVKKIILNGWIQSRRDLGNLIFIDLRDRYGNTQVVLDTSENPSLMEAGHKLRPEFVIAVHGTVRARPEKDRKPDKATGDIEVLADSIEILNSAITPPFEILDDIHVSDEIRMRYRYLDIRRGRMQQNLLLRHKIVLALRNAFAQRDFLEVETPVLTKSTPEGARDYLVPARVHPGRFYALPQSPQLFKQLLMVGGVDRYFQIVRCMRDEDLRADRQPEFTQLDVEMSFVEEEEVFAIIEAVLVEVLDAIGKGPLELPLPRLTYEEAVTRYGTDKPDIRFGMELYDLTDVARGCGFKVFQSVAEGGGLVLGINAKGCAGYSRKEIDGLTPIVADQGARGLAWMKLGGEGPSGPIAKFFKPEELDAIKEHGGGEAGDLLLIVAASPRVARAAMAELRNEMGARLGLAGEGFQYCWITDFPMFDEDEDTGVMVPSHHPFTTPREEYEGHLEKDPRSLKARAYDLVLNGVELGSGSVRIHDRGLQARVFEVLGIGEEEAREKFGFLLDAFEYGAPPHAGIALGLDRMVMLLAGMTNIREVIAFPKSATGGCPLTGAPAEVDPRLLADLNLALVKKKGGANPEV
jgi:aspartyl-tRNA synthetase